MARNTLKNICRLIDAVNKDVPVEEMFLTDLKRSIEIDGEKEARKPSQTYKPSGLGCMRAMYYGVVGADCDSEKPNYSSVGICNSGSDIHVRIQTAISRMKENGIDCEYIDVAEFVKSRNIPDIEVVDRCGMETKLYNRALNMSFLSDGIIKYHNHYYIVEFKTEASFKWTARTGVDAKHLAQATAYSLSLQLPEVLFVYINRDLLDMKSYMFVPTDDDKEALIARIATCDEFVANKELPPKPTDLPRNACNYCGYRSLCEAENNGIKEDTVNE